MVQGEHQFFDAFAVRELLSAQQPATVQVPFGSQQSLVLQQPPGAQHAPVAQQSSSSQQVAPSQQLNDFAFSLSAQQVSASQPFLRSACVAERAGVNATVELTAARENRQARSIPDFI
jgi:hypothetical protein